MQGSEGALMNAAAAMQGARAAQSGHRAAAPDALRALPSLSALVEEAATIPGVDARACVALREKIAQHAFNLVVVGEFKRGKSTVINALLGADLLPTGVVPLTSVVTVIQYGAQPTVTVNFEARASQATRLDALAGYVTEAGNPQNIKGVREVTVVFPAEWLQGGIRLVDTPGIGSVHRHNTEVTYRYLPRADAVIFVASADQPLSQAELDFLATVRNYAGKVFCLLNKMDYLTPAEQAESLAFVVGAVTAALGTPVPVFGVSARQSLQAQATGAEPLAQASGMPAFGEVLRRFLSEEGGEVWMASLLHQLQRLLAEARLTVELELRALNSPLKVLESNLRAMSARKVELLQDTSDVDAVLEADARKLIREQVEPELAVFKEQLTRRLQADLGSWCEELKDRRATDFRAGLEERLIAEVRGVYEIWQADADAKLNRAFEGLCARVERRIQDSVDDLLRYSAELFDIPFAAVSAQTLWRSPTRFYFKSWDEPPGLKQLTNSLVPLLPRVLGSRLILRDARRRATDLADMQAGRLRHDFDERLRDNVRSFRQDLLQRIERTLQGIEAAIEQGRAMRVRGETEAAARREELTATLSRIASLEARVRLDS